MKQENKNCLVGWKCPDCGSIGPFDLSAVEVKRIRLHDSGTEDIGSSSTEWESHSDCECVECGYAGVVSDFDDPVEPATTMTLDNGVLWFEDGTSVSDVNSHLLKAAPNLLSVCLRLEEILECECGTIYDTDNGEECPLCELSQAVAKATNTTQPFSPSP